MDELQQSIIKSIDDRSAETLIRKAFKTKDKIKVNKLTKNPRNNLVVFKVAKKLEICDVVYRYGYNWIVINKIGRKQRHLKQIDTIERELPNSTVFRLVTPDRSLARAKYGYERLGKWPETIPMYAKRIPDLQEQYGDQGFVYLPGEKPKPGHLIIPNKLYEEINAEICRPLQDGTQFSLKPTDLSPSEVWALWLKRNKSKVVAQ